MNRRDFLSKTLRTGLGITIGTSIGAELLSATGCNASEKHVVPARSSAHRREETAKLDWPVYRHDVALTGTSPGRGKIVQPEVLWEYYLGPPFIAIATNTPPAPPNIADLDGDGKPEKFILEGHTIRVMDMADKLLWSYTVRGHPLGGNVRVCHLFPGRKDQQIISFSSRMDNGDGQGYCFAFSEGASRGELLWTTGPMTGQYAPTLIVDDVDGDGLPEIVLAPHYRVQIFNGQTGALKAEVSWDVGRNYGFLCSRPRPGRREKDIFIICDFVLHVDCIRFQNGKWTHAWGHKYIEPNAPVPRGREKYIRVGPNPMGDFDGDGKDEVVYMLIDAAAGDRWMLRVRDGETGRVKVDVPDTWLWSIADLDGDGREEILYTPTASKRPPTYCNLHIGRLAARGLTELAVLQQVRPLQMNATLPLTVHTIADEGLLDILRADFNGDGKPEIFCAHPGRKGMEDRLSAWSFVSKPRPELKRTWQVERAGHRLNLLHAGPDETGKPIARFRDLTEEKLVTVDARGGIIRQEAMGRPGGFTTLPIVADIDGDGRMEIVLQNAVGEIMALRPGRARTDKPTVLWSRPGWAMNHAPGYTLNGYLCPQAGDLDGDGLPEIVFATEDKSGLCAVSCVDGSGKVRWSRLIEGCPMGGLQAGVDQWTFGRFLGREKGLDVYVSLHRRSKGSSEGWMLRGDTGEVAWQQEGLVAKETAMPFGGGVPAVADVNRDGLDELIQAFYTIYGVISGKTGEPIFPPAYLVSPSYFGKWVAYSWPTAADLDGDGRLDVYLNSASYARGAYAAVRIDGKPMWAEFHDNEQGSDGLGPVGDFDGDGKPEIGVPVLNNTLLCLNAVDGSHKWRITAPVTGDVIAADINGDGIMELIFNGKDGLLRAVSGKDGREVWAIAAPGRPIVADANSDGFLEVLTVGADGVLRVIGKRTT